MLHQTLDRNQNAAHHTGAMFLFAVTSPRAEGFYAACGFERVG
jgi:N-acetylglutamate synthase-like GNAT family acetyltransferase